MLKHFVVLMYIFVVLELQEVKLELKVFVELIMIILLVLAVLLNKKVVNIFILYQVKVQMKIHFFFILSHINHC